jgi:hypothetical protein
LYKRWPVSDRPGLLQAFTGRWQIGGCVPGARQIHIGGHAFTAFIELPEVEGGPAVAASSRSRIPDRGLRHVARRPAAAVEHDRDIEFRPRVTQFRRAPHGRKSLDGVGRPLGADV